MRQLFALTAILALAACGSPAPAPAEPDAREVAPTEARTAGPDCVAKGEAYFKEIESWPTLSNGSDAREVVAERCARTTGAFDGLS